MVSANKKSKSKITTTSNKLRQTNLEEHVKKQNNLVERLTKKSTRSKST